MASCRCSSSCCKLASLINFYFAGLTPIAKISLILSKADCLSSNYSSLVIFAKAYYDDCQPMSISCSI